LYKINKIKNNRKEVFPVFCLRVAREVLLHVEAGHFVVRVPDFYGGHSGECRVRRHVAEHDGSRANLCAIADVDVPQKLGVRAEHDAVADFRVTVADFVAGTAERNPVQKADVVPDDGGFADDDVCRMVNQEPVTDLCRGVKIHAKLAADDVLEHLGRETPVFEPERMRDSVGLEPLETLEQQERLEVAGARGGPEDGRVQILAGGNEELGVLDVHRAENGFQFRTVDDFAGQLAGEGNGKHVRKVLAV
jgi:hypothetical protein